MIEDLTTLTLVDGIPVEREGKTIKYRLVRLRETNVQDERIATKLAERVMIVAGLPKLLVSDADFQYAMTMRHIEALECDGLVIPQALIDLDLFGKLSSHDLGLIEQRVFLLTLAAEVRYGTLTQEDFDKAVAGELTKGAPAPQPVGQAPELGQADSRPGPGPALLADYVRDDAAGTPAGAGS